jgi:hypothetical protein
MQAKLRASLLTAALMTGGLVAGVGAADAQTGTPTAAPASAPAEAPPPAPPVEMPKAPPGFEPLKGAEARAEAVDASSLVVGAYGSILVLMFGFVIWVARGQAALAREMSELAGKLERAEKR